MFVFFWIGIEFVFVYFGGQQFFVIDVVGYGFYDWFVVGVVILLGQVVVVWVVVFVGLFGEGGIGIEGIGFLGYEGVEQFGVVLYGVVQQCGDFVVVGVQLWYVVGVWFVEQVGVVGQVVDYCQWIFQFVLDLVDLGVGQGYQVFVDDFF